MLMKVNTILDEVYKILARDNSKLYDIWATQILFSWRWWTLLGLSIIPWIIWFKIRNKNDIVRLLFVGLVAAIISNTLDTIGVIYNLWHYDWKITPFIPMYFPWDFTLMPVGIMIMLQFKPKINRYIKAIIFSFGCAYVFEPLFSWLSVYHTIHWKYWYSFIINIFLYLYYDYLYRCKLWQRHSNS